MRIEERANRDPDVTRPGIQEPVHSASARRAEVPGHLAAILAVADKDG